MKVILKVSFFAVAAFAVSFPVFAAQTSDMKNEELDYSQQDSLGDMGERDGMASGVNANNANLNAGDPNSMEDMNERQGMGAGVNANNTALNARDRDRTSITPLDQGNTKQDIDVTAAIRKDIMGRKGMSVDAQNVKVITRNGTVTLRGPVKTAEEKRFIAEVAQNRFASGNIDNQLEVIGNVQYN